MLSFSYQVKQIDIGGVVDIFSWRCIQIHCRYFSRFFDPRTSTSIEQSFLNSECIYNQGCYGIMETTGGFSASNWSRIHHPRSGDAGGDKNIRNQAKSASTLPIAQEVERYG